MESNNMYYFVWILSLCIIVSQMNCNINVVSRISGLFIISEECFPIWIYHYLFRVYSCADGHLSYFQFFFFNFIFKLYIIVLVLPNIKMNPPQVHMPCFFSSEIHNNILNIRDGYIIWDSYKNINGKVHAQ